MISMVAHRSDRTASLGAKVEATLKRCADWSRLGRHQKVLKEVEHMLSLTAEQPRFEAELLIWKAQALLSMGEAERAFPVAARSWELQASAHACHLMANALTGLGDLEQAEGFLRVGWELFPDSVHLPIQLAMVLADQGRVPEALDVLDDLEADSFAEDVEVFLAGLHANLLAASGQWSRAESRLRETFRRHPDSPLLLETQTAINQAHHRTKSERFLVASWKEGLSPLDGVALEVDDSIVRCGAVLELPALVVVAARRLWRAYRETAKVRPQSPDAWAAATLLVIEELDERQRTAAAFARATRCRPPTVSTARRKIRAFLNMMDPRLARRSFAARTNPRLDDSLEDRPDDKSRSKVLSFRVDGNRSSTT
jgi:tetratricopeptide (TPR) repeat protein